MVGLFVSAHSKRAIGSAVYSIVYNGTDLVSMIITIVIIIFEKGPVICSVHKFI